MRDASRELTERSQLLGLNQSALGGSKRLSGKKLNPMNYL